MDTIGISFRLPKATVMALKALAKQLGMTQTQVMIIAIDRMANATGKKGILK